MDAKRIRGLRAMLAMHLKRFDDCFARKVTRAHLSVYVGLVEQLAFSSRILGQHPVYYRKMRH